MSDNVGLKVNASLHNRLDEAIEAEALGNYDEAEQVSLKILASLSSLGVAEQAREECIALQADTNRMLGIVAFRRAKYSEALGYLQSALQLGEQIRDKAGIARSLNIIGNVQSGLSENTKALECYGKALSIAEEVGDQRTKAICLSNIGFVHSTLSNYNEALEYYTKALSLAEELGNKYGVVACLSNIGIVYDHLSDFSKALEYYSMALVVAEETGNKLGVATLLSNIGVVHLNLSDFPKAIEYYVKALSLAEELGDKLGESIQLGNIGNVHFRLSNYATALEFYEKALRLDKELANTAGISRHLGNIGIVYSNLGEYHKALEYYRTALSLTEELGDRTGVTRQLSNIGSVHAKLGDYAQALEYYTGALSLCEELRDRAGVAGLLGGIGDVHMKLLDYTKAQEYIERALRLQEELGMKSEVGEIKALLGELYASDANPNCNVTQAEAYLLEAIDASQDLGTKAYNAHNTLADLYEKQKRWEDAYRHQGLYFRLKEEVLSEEARKKAGLMEQQKRLAERDKEIAITKAAADAQIRATTKLLHKVLPQSVATRMMDGEEEIADYYTSVSILFADIAGFTPISADMPAIIVVRLLNYVFAEFDRIIKKHGCEKIKTIGDGYMAISGAPIECADHAERLTAAAIEMQETISLPESIREYLPRDVKLGVRIGLHTGSVVAGVIGEERFVYDIYSDAVNTAARMESHGEENRIHVSNDFFRHLQNRFAVTKNATHGLVFEKRGEMEIKGKGVLRTYFLEKA